MSDDLERLVREYVSPEESRRLARRPRRKAIGVWAKILVLGAVMITLATAVLAAVVLFSQTPSYTSNAALKLGCTAPTGTASGTLITFSCPAGYAFTVVNTATGFASYSAFSFPSNVTITDAYLIDTLATPATSCGAWSGGANTNVLLHNAAPISITIGTGAGKIAPGHSYDYCTDFTPPIANFTFSITWSQG